jgi:hypothetical protein
MSQLRRNERRSWAIVSLAIFVFSVSTTTTFLFIAPEAPPVLALTSGISVACSPSSVFFGSASKCTATVTGQSPTGTVGWTSSEAGTFTASTCTLSSGSCKVQYTPSSTSSPVTITANYQGDSKNAASSGSFSLLVAKAHTTTNVSCSPSHVVVGGLSLCASTVTGVNQTGTVIWATNGNGAFQSTICTLSSGQCSVVYVPSSTSTATITASYGGDANNGNSSGSSSLVATKSSTTTSVSCSPSSIFQSSPSSCVATVGGYHPGGDVTFAATGNVGTFLPLSGA